MYWFALVVGEQFRASAVLEFPDPVNCRLGIPGLCEKKCLEIPLVFSATFPEVDPVLRRVVEVQALGTNSRPISFRSVSVDWSIGDRSKMNSNSVRSWLLCLPLRSALSRHGDSLGAEDRNPAVDSTICSLKTAHDHSLASRPCRPANEELLHGCDEPSPPKVE